MTIDKNLLAKMFQRTAELWLERSDELSAIDSKFGDGDHGVTIKKIAKLLLVSLPKLQETSMYDFFEEIGRGIMGISGGSAGPLYGTMIGGLGLPLEGRDTIDAQTMKEMLRSSLNEMQDITAAKVGDKTMMDSLIPAVESVEAAEAMEGSVRELPELLRAMSEAALKGAEESKAYISKYGRAKSYKEATIGTPDAGAVSTSLFFKGLYEGYLEGVREKKE